MHANAVVASHAAWSEETNRSRLGRNREGWMGGNRVDARRWMGDMLEASAVEILLTQLHELHGVCLTKWNQVRRTGTPLVGIDAFSP